MPLRVVASQPGHDLCSSSRPPDNQRRQQADVVVGGAPVVTHPPVAKVEVDTHAPGLALRLLVGSGRGASNPGSMGAPLALSTRYADGTGLSPMPASSAISLAHATQTCRVSTPMRTQVVAGLIAP